MILPLLGSVWTRAGLKDWDKSAFLGCRTRFGYGNFTYGKRWNRRKTVRILQTAKNEEKKRKKALTGEKKRGRIVKRSARAEKNLDKP